MKRILTIIIGISMCVWGPFPAAAQISASLGGSVADATGALIPGVEVTARNVGTGIANTAITNETGTYQFPNLQTGTYEVSAVLPGFRTQRFTNVLLGGAQQARLNFTLEVADVATTVEVTADAGGALVTTAASIASVLPESQVSSLPLGDRNVLELLAGMAGTGPTDGDLDGNFAGNRLSAVNVTRDGMTVGTGRYDQGTLGVSYMSPDLVEEVRVTTGTVDAEAGRGSGQVQMVTRSGTNSFRGSVFWNNRNSALDAANWFNNFEGVAGDFENRNQYGIRLGGPIIRDKTFFFFLLDNQRTATRENFVGTVLTNEARRGIFRFFPGANNANARANRPTVDLAGNPVRPSNATGDLRSINLFQMDPFRPDFDPSGWIQNVLLARMPQPNDFTVGDGLNTAGIRFTRRVYGWDTNIQDQVDRNNRDQFNLRIDHYFNSANKLSFIYTLENSRNHATAQGIQQWPDGYDGANDKYPRVYNFQLVSTIASNVVNELRWGYKLHDVRAWAPFYVGRDYEDESTMTEEAKEAFALLPQSNGIPYQPVPQIFSQGFMSFSAGFGSTRGSYSPMWSIGDNISWIKGEHAFKIGFEYRSDRTRGFNDNNFTPQVTLGAGNVPAPITSATVAGLTSPDATTARNILYNLAGSIDSVRQGFDLRSPTPPLEFLGYQDGVKLKSRDWIAPEFNAFFKDDWKLTPNLTLNLGVSWAWYGVPYNATGLAAKVIGGFDGLCGIGCTGELTRLEFVGKNSPNPDKQLFNDDWNNFAPAVGFSWSLPGFERSTILRAGYGISYTGRQIANAMSSGGLDSGAGTLPGAFGGFGCCGQTYEREQYWSLGNLTEIPFESQFEPLEPFPLTAPRTLTMNMYEPNRRTPYVQNFNVSIQRELASNLVLDLSYVGSKGTKLYGRLPLNVAKIHETGFLEAFNITRAGGNAELFDRMLMGLRFPGGIGTVDGQRLTGSSALRQYSSTRTDLANGEVGAVADFIARSSNVTGDAGGFLRNGGLPEDFLYFNPQFQEVGLNTNPGSSSYHSLQVQMTKRLSHGFTNQVSYTWSKSLGLSDSDHNLFSRDPNNRNGDKAVLGFHRTHILSSNGTYALPFGSGRSLLADVPGWVDNLVGQWQLGGIFRWTSGAPLSLTAGGIANVWQQANNTAKILGALPEPVITFYTDGSRPTYFPGVTQGTDPSRLALTSVDRLNTAGNLRAIFDANGNPLLVNPAPGEVGSLGLRTIEGPSRFQLDMNLQKRVQIDEDRNLEFRADVTNILNHPVFGNPQTNINSTSFGQITDANSGRKFVLGARLNF